MHISVRTRVASDCEITRSHRDNYISIENNVRVSQRYYLQRSRTCLLNISRQIRRDEFSFVLLLYIYYIYIYWCQIVSWQLIISKAFAYRLVVCKLTYFSKYIHEEEIPTTLHKKKELKTKKIACPEIGAILKSRHAMIATQRLPTETLVLFFFVHLQFRKSLLLDQYGLRIRRPSGTRSAFAQFMNRSRGERI